MPLRVSSLISINQSMFFVPLNYPRSVGYGFVNMTARIGAIIAPFALDLVSFYITIARNKIFPHCFSPKI